MSKPKVYCPICMINIENPKVGIYVQCPFCNSNVLHDGRYIRSYNPEIETCEEYEKEMISEEKHFNDIEEKNKEILTKHFQNFQYGFLN